MCSSYHDRLLWWGTVDRLSVTLVFTAFSCQSEAYSRYVLSVALTNGHVERVSGVGVW